MSERDRDGAGHGQERAAPRRARAAAAVRLDRGPALPEVALSPVEALQEAQRLLDDGLPFQAHEVLEGTWKSAPDGERDLWQGLAQLAVGLTHARRGNRPGAVALLRRGRDNIAGYAPAPPYGIDIPGLLDWAEKSSSSLESDRAVADPPRLRRPPGSVRRGEPNAPNPMS